MSGIVGVVGTQPAEPVLLEALGRLEYRGYDNAGIATLVNGRIDHRWAPGKLTDLRNAIERAPLLGVTGIGHISWAARNPLIEWNDRLHSTERVAIVLNGTIDNQAELRREMEQEALEFETTTDTEAITRLIDLHLRRGSSPLTAVKRALSRLSGAYALAMIFAGHPELIIGVQHGSALALGFGDEAMYLGSDALALSTFTRRIAVLHNGDWAVITREFAQFFGPDGTSVEREILAGLAGHAVDRGEFRHYMEKELHEEPAIIDDALHRLVDPASCSVVLPNLPFDFAAVSHISICGCGSAYYAGLVARSWLETEAGLLTDADVASEFRYRAPPLPDGGVGLLLSVSGEDTDTLAVLGHMREVGQQVLSVVNVRESSIARKSDAVLETRAGSEIGIGSTKTFTVQLVVLACLALAAARARGKLSSEREALLTAALLAAPKGAAEVLARQDSIRALAGRVAQAHHVLYLGRGNCFPIALEGALKLKELCYIHAEGYAAGEIRYGPSALIDKSMLVIAIAPSGALFEKTAANLEEAAARGAQVIVFCDVAGAVRLRGIAAAALVVPEIDPFAAPILYALAIQLLAYHVAVLKGADVDRPRNLAKSLGVEGYKDFDQELTPAAVAAPEYKPVPDDGSTQRGSILWNPPDRMRVGHRERIEVRLGDNDVVEAQLRERLHGRGMPQIDQLEISPLMRVVLIADLHDFAIQALSNSDQYIRPTHVARWDFDVEPLRGGMRVLRILVSMRLRVEGKDELVDLPSYERTVLVSVAPLRALGRFCGDHWQWLAGSILIPIVAWTVTRTSIGAVGGRYLRLLLDHL